MEAIRKVLQEGDDYDLPTDGAECLIEVIEDVDCFFPEKEVGTCQGMSACFGKNFCFDFRWWSSRPGAVMKVGLKHTKVTAWPPYL